MKQNLYLCILLIISLFYSCKAPTTVEITVTPMEAEATVNSKVTFYIQLKPDALNGGELGDLEVFDENFNFLQKEEFVGYQTDSTRFVYQVPSDASIGDTIRFYVIAEDSYSKLVDTVSPIIIVSDGVPKLISQSNIQLFYSDLDTVLTNQLVLSDKSIVVDTLNSPSCFLTFVWTNETGYSLVSPDAQWLTEIFTDTTIYNPADKQHTAVQLFDGEWETLTSHYLDSLPIVSETIESGDNGLFNLHEANILLFETQDSVKGAILIKTTAKTSNYLIIDVLFQDK